MSNPRIVNRMPQFVEAVQQRAARAVLQALIIGGGEVAGLTPRHTSNLINSQFRKVDQQGAKIVGTFAYTADYALAVHEAPGKTLGLNIPRADKKGVYWGPSGEPGFVTKGFERAEPKIRAVITGAIRT